jgi:hypothetical protein
MLSQVALAKSYANGQKRLVQMLLEQLVLKKKKKLQRKMAVTSRLII